MAGIYVHIPFCKQACTYCDFHFSTSLSRKDEMVSAICREIELRKEAIPFDEGIHSIYFGGGTPSILDVPSLEKLFEALYSYFLIDQEAEITFEVNPDDMDTEKLIRLKELGINRLSIGIQSIYDVELKWMNRSHSASEALVCIERARSAGFENMSVDLIFGTPYTSLTSWERLLTHVIELQIPHLSIYALTIEEKTALAHWVEKERIVLPDEDLYEAEFLLAHEILKQAGYEHYELSNYALPGKRAIHNSSYWEGTPYLGLGPSAHSYDGITRFSNVANNSKYLAAIQSGKPAIAFEETLTPMDKYHEYILTHLRKVEGIDIEWIKNHLSVDPGSLFGEKFTCWEQKGYMIKQDSTYKLTPKGWFICDMITRELFIDG